MRNSEILTAKELVMTYIKIDKKTDYRFTSEGKLLGFKVGGAWRFRKSEINQWTKEQGAHNTTSVKDTCIGSKNED
jgi:excisionase family DNA binding protein